MRVANTGLYASGAHTAGTYAYFDYVCPTQDQLLCHVRSDHIASDDHMLGKGLSHQFNKITKMFTVAVGHIYADELDLWLCFEYHLQFGKFYFTGTGTHSQAIRINLTAFAIPIGHGVIFDHARKHFMLGQAAGHGPCAHSIHVGRHDGNARPSLLAVSETITATQVYFSSGAKSATLGPDQHITEIQFDIFFYTHASSAKYRRSSLSVGSTV